MNIIDTSSYWTPLCNLRSRLRLWVRVGWRTRGSTHETHVTPWGQLLTLPVDGCLEPSGGPIAIRDVLWAEFSTRRISGGMAGRPRQMIDIKDDILSGLRGAERTWEVREATWSIEGLFDDEPVEVVRVLNPFGTTPEPLS